MLMQQIPADAWMHGMRRLCIYLRLKAFQAEGIAEAKVQKCKLHLAHNKGPIK